MASLPAEEAKTSTKDSAAIKHCFGCSLDLPLDLFYKNTKRKDGRQTQCKPCMAQHASRWYDLNTDRHRQVNKVYEEANADKLKRYRKEWQDTNVARRAAVGKQWKNANKDKVTGYSAKRRALDKHAAPPWLTYEQWHQINAMYALSRKLTAVTGVTHEVDHIHPLTHPNFCGLHVPWNLQVIPASENRAKGNKLLTT